MLFPFPNRRRFLQQSAALSLPLFTGFAQATNQKTGFPGLVLREKDPENLEFPFHTLDSFLVPNERFFVRSHFAMPDLNKDTYRLKVEGSVDHPLNLSYADLIKMPPKTETSLLECAGNGRIFLTPKARGLNWEQGAVGAAEWTGVSLLDVLAQAGPKRSAVQVVLEGADEGEVRDDPRTPGKIHFARSLPLKKAMRPEVLLAYKMNGAELPKAHGFPLRAVVPGWYSVASVKWLKRIVVVDQPFNGYYQSLDYSYFTQRDGLPTLFAVGELDVKSQIARPARGEVVPVNAPYRVHGAAWTGESEIQRVEFSADGGKSWRDARLLDKVVRYAWRFWEFTWTPSRAGMYTLMVRATDQRGRTQPMERDVAKRTYMISHVLPIEVEAR